MTLRPCRPGECKRVTEDADWGIYRGCFPRGIEPTDIDGFVEVNGHFLVIDRKKDTDNPRNFRRGQEDAFSRLALLRHVTFITEILHVDETLTWRIKCGGQTGGWRNLTLADARAWMTAWSEFVENTGQAPSLKPGEPTGTPISYHLAMNGDK